MLGSMGSAGKVVLIIGSGDGVGEATARRLVKAGHRVVLGADDRFAAVADEIGADHHELDVASLESMRSFVRTAQRRHGRVDVLINNAGLMPSPVHAPRPDEWNRMIDISARGVLYGITAAFPIMCDQGAGDIVNFTSTSGHRVDTTAAVHGATRFAVRTLTTGRQQETPRVTVISVGSEGISDTAIQHVISGQ